jgi:hypothetical protein
MPRSSGHRPSPYTVDLPKAVTAKATATLSTWVLIIDTAACVRRKGSPCGMSMWQRCPRRCSDRPTQEAERDNDVGFVLNRLRNVYKHRRRPLLAATLAREGGR